MNENDRQKNFRCEILLRNEKKKLAKQTYQHQYSNRITFTKKINAVI
jgi:hypothetical protein